MSTEVARLHALVSGLVQGVGFRYFVRDKAQTLGAAGWVRNLHNGNVELIVEAERAKLDELVTELKLGPRGSAVSNVEVEWGEATAEFSDFSIAKTN